jgi:hypothetical protein
MANGQWGMGYGVTKRVRSGRPASAPAPAPPNPPPRVRVPSNLVLVPPPPTPRHEAMTEATGHEPRGPRGPKTEANKQPVRSPGNYRPEVRGACAYARGLCLVSGRNTNAPAVTPTSPPSPPHHHRYPRSARPTPGVRNECSIFGPNHRPTTEKSAHPTKRDAPPCPWRTSVSTPLRLWLDRATIRIRFFGQCASYTGSFCVFGLVLSSPAHGLPSLAMDYIEIEIF